MANKNPEEFVTVQMKRTDYKKLEDYKVHKNQPYWEIISKLIKKEDEQNDTETKKSVE